MAVDILLVQPPIRDFYFTAKRTFPYGLSCMAAALESCGFSVAILDALATDRSRIVDWPPEMDYLRPYYGRGDRSPFALFHHYRHYGYSYTHLMNQARRVRPWLVGVSSLFTAYQAEARRTVEALKTALPDCRLVVGGHHATVRPHEVLEWPGVDFVLRGDGEAGLPALALALHRGGAVDAVPGLAVRRDDGRLRITPTAQAPRPFPPALHLVDRRFYSRRRQPAAVVVASRGCPLNCSYCCFGARSSVRYRRRDPADVLAEIESALGCEKAGFVEFEDENLSLDRRWFHDLLRGIERRFDPGRIELRAMNGLLPTTLDDETVGRMKAAGFRALNLSLGSTCRRQLARFRRPDVRAAFDHCLDMAATHGLKAVGYVIAAAPDQSAAGSLTDLLYLLTRRVLAAVSIYYPAPGSEDYRRCTALGLLPASASLLRSSALPISDITTRRQAVTLLRLGRVVNFIKSELDADRGLPAPATGSPPRRIKTAGHVECGRRLLAWFRKDGKLRGVTPDGDLYVHQTDRALVRGFLAGLEVLQLRGTR